MDELTEARSLKFERVARNSQLDLTIVLENVHDPHNIGAVLRTCDSVGVREVYILYTNKEMAKGRKPTIGKSSSSGARKWVDIKYYEDRKLCFNDIRKKYNLIFATHLGADSKSIYDIDMTEPIALLFGNEHAGVTKETLELCDGNFLIPQVGMTESLNISVACAVSLYEAYRQRDTKGAYNGNVNSEEVVDSILAGFKKKHKPRWKEV